MPFTVKNKPKSLAKEIHQDGHCLGSVPDAFLTLSNGDDIGAETLSALCNVLFEGQDLTSLEGLDLELALNQLWDNLDLDRSIPDEPAPGPVLGLAA